MKKQNKKWGTLSVLSLTTGIMGLVAVPFLFSTTAVITGAIAVSKKQKGAWAGLICGLVGWVAGLIAFYIAMHNFQVAMDNLATALGGY